MYAKIKIQGTVEVITGMHIGGSSAFSAIGAVDSPVMRDSKSYLPMIPGSSLKGKMRTLLAKSYNKDWVEDKDKDDERILRIFGHSTKKKAQRGRLLFSDMVMSNAKELREQGLTSLTEVKFENTISRTTAVANPRQIERVVRGSEFALDLIYDLENEEEAVKDFELIAEGLKLLQYDYIGGHGTRGYGKIAFHDLKVSTVLGKVDDAVLEKCQTYLNGVIYEK